MKPADPKGSRPPLASLQERQCVVLPPEKRETENERLRRLEAVIVDVRIRLMAAEAFLGEALWGR